MIYSVKNFFSFNHCAFTVQGKNIIISKIFFTPDIAIHYIFYSKSLAYLPLIVELKLDG